MTASTLAGKSVATARVHLPAWGCWWAEVGLTEEATLTGRVELVVADLKLTGTIMSGGIGPVGRSSFRIVGGAGGWGKTIPQKSYAIDNGVRAAAVLGDAADACGETFESFPSDRVGPAFVRPEEPASRVLEQLYPSGWYVGEDGRTRVGKRAATAFEGKAEVLGVDRTRATVALAAESIAPLVPGVIVEGLEAVDVLHELTPSSLRTTIWGNVGVDTTRDLVELRRIVDALDPDRKFRGLYEYRIVLQHDERLDLQPVRVSTGMPVLQRVRVRPGVPGVRADHKLGSRVVVGFVDRTPFVVGFEDADGDGWQPNALTIGEGEAVLLGSTAAPKRYVRYGDPIVFAAPGPGTVTAPAAPATLSTVRSA